MLTAISGSLVGTFHEHELSSGRVRVIFTERLDDVVFQDESGNTYRAVGADTANFTIDPDLGRGSEIGHLIFNITLIGEDGKYGDLRLHTRVTHSGEISIRDKGSCQFA